MNIGEQEQTKMEEQLSQMMQGLKGIKEMKETMEENLRQRNNQVQERDNSKGNFQGQISDKANFQSIPSQGTNVSNPMDVLNVGPLNENSSEMARGSVEQKRYNLLEERIRVIEGRKELCDPKEYCLVPDVVIPPKFKVPEFEKYDGSKCPKTHLATYCHKMIGYAHDEKLLIHIFQDSLTGAAISWYLKLKKGQILTWRDLSRAFLEQYRHLMELAPDRLTLQNMRKNPNESYKEYALRWKETASQVQPPLTNREMNSLFVDTLPSPYYDKLIGNVFSEFADLLFSVGRIEDGIKRGKIMDTNTGNYGGEKWNTFVEQVQEATFDRSNKRKSNVMQEPLNSHSHLSVCTNPLPQSLYPNTVAPYLNKWPQSSYPCTSVPYAQALQPQLCILPNDHEVDPVYFETKKRKRAKLYHSIPMSYTDLFPLLVQNYKISTIHTKPRKPPYPKWYDPNTKCDYHDGVEGHSIENCSAFKDKVQALIDADPVKFKELVCGY